MVADHPSDPARTGSLFADEASAHAGVGAAVPDEALKRLAVQLPDRVLVYEAGQDPADMHYKNIEKIKQK